MYNFCILLLMLKSYTYLGVHVPHRKTTYLLFWFHAYVHGCDKEMEIVLTNMYNMLYGVLFCVQIKSDLSLVSIFYVSFSFKK